MKYNKIKEVAEKKYPFADGSDKQWVNSFNVTNEKVRQGFIFGAEFALKETGIKELIDSLNLIIGACAGVGWNGMDPNITIGRIDAYAQTALSKLNNPYIEDEDELKENILAEAKYMSRPDILQIVN